MPLKAYLNDQPLIAPLLDDERWKQLRDDVNSGAIHLHMPCCDAECYPRVSKLGTRHFVHRRGGHCGAEGETMEHLLAKALAAQGCKDAGYSVETEVQGDCWRADVLAEHGRNRIVIEIQCSPQTLEETEIRQEQYRASGLRCAWLFRRMPCQATAKKDTPMFQMDFNDRENPTVNGFPLRKFVAELLMGHFKFCENEQALPQQTVVIDILNYECWHCRRSCHIIREEHDESMLKTAHGLTEDWDAIYPEGVEFSPYVLRALANFLQSEAGKNFKIGQIKKRFSKTVGYSYMSQGCPFCDTLFGDFFLNIEPDVYLATAIAKLEDKIPLDKPFFVPNAHWCYSPTRQFCC